MDSFALVYFEEEKRYCAVAVASIKDGGKNVNKGSEVIVLGSTFDPVANAEIDEEWPAKLVKFGSERGVKRDAPRFNEKARHFKEQESLKSSRKRIANPRYNDGADDANEEATLPSKINKKKNAKQPLREKNIVSIPCESEYDSADEYIPSSDIEEDENMFLEKITKRAREGKKTNKIVQVKKKYKKKKPGQQPEDTHKDDSNDNYKEKYLELQLQLQLQEQLQKEIRGEKTAEESDRKEKERQEWKEQAKIKQKEQKQKEKEEKEREEWEKCRLEREKFQQWQEHQNRKQKEREQREKEKKERKEEQRKMRLKEIETLETRRQEEKQVEKQRHMQGHDTGDIRDYVGHTNDPSEEAGDDELDWLTELSEIKPKCAGCSFLAKQVYHLQKELKELNEKCHRSKKPEASKSTEEDEQELMQKQKVTKEDCIKALQTTSKSGQSIRELMDMVFTSHELSTCSVRGKKTHRPALPKERWHLLTTVIMEKFKEIKETNIVSIANVKLQEHRY